MIYPIIRASITTEEAYNELLDRNRIVLHRQKRVKVTDLIDPSTQIVDPRFVAKLISEEKKVANFSTSTASFCLDKIVMQHGLHAAWARIRRHREEGKYLVKKICDMKGFTAGKFFRAKLSHVGAPILQVYEENIAEQDEVEQVQSNTVAITYHKTRDDVDTILATGILPTNMSNVQL